MAVSGISVRVTPEIRAELARLAKRGRLSERTVVSASKSPTSPLHPLFYWEDSDKAAHIGRLEIARQLILKVKVEPHVAKELRCSVNVRQYHGTGEGHYMDVRTIMSDEALRRTLLTRALREFEALRAKYEHLGELASVFEEIAKVRGSQLVESA